LGTLKSAEIYLLISVPRKKTENLEVNCSKMTAGRTKKTILADYEVPLSGFGFEMKTLSFRCPPNLAGDRIFMKVAKFFLKALPEVDLLFCWRCQQYILLQNMQTSYFCAII